MANKVVKTRVQNRFDTLSAWEASSATKLLKGEIAIVSVTTTTTDDSGNIIQVPAYLMKIGNGTDTFNDLPWLSATAADVYDWAKGETAEGLNIDVKVGSATTATTKTLGAWIKSLQDTNDTQGAAITALESKVDVAKVSTAISTAINALDSTSSGSGTIVKAVTQTNGKVAVTMGTLSASEIPSLPTSKITTGDSTYDTLDEMLGNINAKLASVNTDVLGGLDVTNSDATDDSTSTSTAVKFVSQVTQTDGKIAVQKRSIQLADIPTITSAKLGSGAVTEAKIGSNAVTTTKIKDGNVTDAKIASVSTDKVTIGSATTGDSLTVKLNTMTGEIAANTAKLAGHTDAAINSLIDAKINDLDSTSSGSGGYVTNVTQTNGKVTVTKGSLPTASTSAAGIVKLGATGGAATYEVAAQNAADIVNLKTAVAGGVHFIGVTTTAISSDSTTSPITINSANVTPVKGDVVIYGTKEYIWSDKWIELGDQGRIATLETKVNNLDYTDPNYAAGKVVTKVTQTDGKITVTHETLASTSVSHGDSTVSAAIGANAAAITALNGKVDVAKVSTAISDAINALDSTSSGSGSFITDVTQTNGKVAVTKGNLPAASSTAAGITKLGATGGAATHDDLVELRDTTVAGIEARVAANEGKLTGVTSTVGASITAAINALDFTAPSVPTTGTTTATAFIDSVSQTDGKITATKKNLPSASTSAKGIVQLSSSTSSTSTSLAATASAVKTAYDKAVEAGQKAAAVQTNYVKYNEGSTADDTGTLIAVENGTEYTIIFDCGGASL